MKLLAVIVLLAVAASANAFYVRSGDNINIPSGRTIDDDVLAAGSQINIQGSVNGTIYAAGSSVSVTGPVTGTLTAAGNTVNLSGQKSTVTLAGSNIQLSSVTARNVVAAGSTISMDDGTRVERDAFLTGNNITVDGTIGRDLRVSGNNITIGSNVSGNVNATGSRISIRPGTVINGDLIYSSPAAIKLPADARVLGEVIRRPYTEKRAGPNPFAAWFLTFIAFWIFGAVFISLFPRWSIKASEQMIANPGWSALWGAIVLIVAPIAILIAAITIIGIPIAISALAVYIVALLLSAIITSITIGRLIAVRSSIWLQLLIGLLILGIVTLIPFLGGLIRFAVILFGLGALALSVRRPGDRLRPAPVP